MIERDVFLRGLEMIHSASMLTVQEATFLYEFAASFDRPITWVELGVWCGRGYWSAGCGLPDGSTLIGVDTFDGKLPECEGSNRIVDFSPSHAMQLAMFMAVRTGLRTAADSMVRCEWFEMTTHKASAYWPIDETDERIDVLVVDAAHDYESVKQDLADWLPKMRPGGTVLVHDYTRFYPGVKQAVDELGDDYCPQFPCNGRFVRLSVP